MIYAVARAQHHVATDRLAASALLVEWAVAVALAVPLGARAVAIAMLAGLVINAAPLALTARRPGWRGTRHANAAALVLWAPVLLWVSRGHIADHHHAFATLAGLALYRDWRVLRTAVLVLGVQMGARCALWPASVLTEPGLGWWMVVEDAAWIAVETAVLMIASLRGERDERASAKREARLERTKAIIERHVHERTLELQESAERYRDLIENMEAVTFEFDAIGHRMRYVSPQACKLLDCTEEELGDGAVLVEALHPEDRVRVRSEIDARLAGLRPWGDPIDCRLISRKGRLVFVRSFLGSRGTYRRLRALLIDMTRARQLEADRQQAQKLESVGRLAAGVAHEINTPIQFIGDSVQFMAQAIEDVLRVLGKQQVIVGGVLASQASDDLVAAAREAAGAAEDADLAYVSEQLPEAAARALDGVERVGAIVRSMKVFAHPDTPDMQAADLNAAIQSTLTIARNEYRYVADLVTRLGDLGEVTCFIGEINQVILNIVINAAHAIADVYALTGERGVITVTSRREDAHVVVEIEDTGHGIPEHVRDRVFDPFFTTKDVGRGTGQGLALARTVIVERHRGTLTFDTTVGRGTTFRITLPAVAPASQRSAA